MPDSDAYPNSDLLTACRSLARAMDCFDEAASKALGVGRSDLRALNLLEHGPLGQAVLAERLNLAPPSVTALVDRLSAGGYVERLAVPGDRRANAIGLRQETWAAFADVYRPLGDHVERSAAHFDDETRMAVVSSLDTLAAAFSTVRFAVDARREHSRAVHSCAERTPDPSSTRTPAERN